MANSPPLSLSLFLSLSAPSSSPSTNTIITSCLIAYRFLKCTVYYVSLNGCHRCSKYPAFPSVTSLSHFVRPGFLSLSSFLPHSLTELQIITNRYDKLCIYLVLTTEGKFTKINKGLEKSHSHTSFLNVKFSYTQLSY